MRILHVIDTLNVGGAERVFVLLTSLLCNHNVHCDAMLLHNTGQLIQELDPRVKLFTLNRDNKYSLKKLKQAHDLCKHYDIIHTHLRHCYAYIRLAQLAFRGRYKIILHDHSSAMPSDIPFRLSGILKPKFYIGVNKNLTNWAKNHLGIRNCYTLQNTISLPISRYQYPNNEQAIMIGNIREVKQVPLAIEICSEADFSLTIYGNRQDQAHFETVTQLAYKTGAKITEGIIDFRNIYSQYSIALHTSRSETGPLVLLEYLANGVPFLAYNTGSVADTIANELPLHFIDTFSIKDWIDRIKLIRSQGDISDRLKAVFSKYYSTDDYLEQCLRIYKSVLY